MPARRFDRNGPSFNTVGHTPSSPPSSAATEASVRQLIASGDHKAALEGAKAFHHASGTAVSEALLVDAYAERIRSLIRRNLTLEAKSLVDLVRQRYPSARKRLNELIAPVAPKTRSLDELGESVFRSTRRRPWWAPGGEGPPLVGRGRSQEEAERRAVRQDP